MEIVELDLLENLKLIIAAYLLALPIAWHREKNARSAGLRTFPLVAVGACAYVLVSRGILASAAEDGFHEGIARVIYGLMTGIGFIGGGAILKNGGRVSGTATAASIWNTGAVGLAVGQFPPQQHQIIPSELQPPRGTV